MLLRTWMRNTRMMQPSRTSSRGRLLRSSRSPTLIFPTVRSFFSRERQTYLILYCEVFRFYDCRIFPGSASLLVLAIYHWDGPSCPPEPSGNPKFRSHKCCPSCLCSDNLSSDCTPQYVPCVHYQQDLFYITFFWGQVPAWQQPQPDISDLGQLLGNWEAKVLVRERTPPQNQNRNRSPRRPPKPRLHFRKPLRYLSCIELYIYIYIYIYI